MIFLSVILTQCVGFKPATSGGKITKYVEEFYTEGGVIQYFIKPLNYKDDSKKDFSFDFTFRNRDVNTDIVTVNFSAETSTVDTLNFIKIMANNKAVSNDDLETLFISKTNDNTFNQRMSLKLEYKNVEEYFFNEHQVQLASVTDTINISPSKKAKKAFEKMKVSLVQKLVPYTK